MLGNNVFDPDQTSVFLTRVVYQALTEIYYGSTVSCYQWASAIDTEHLSEH